MNLKALIRLILVWLLSSGATPSQASSTGVSTAFQFCEAPQGLSAPEQHTLLQFASIVREQLGTLRSQTAIISRSGLDLARLNIRYSHAAIAMQGPTANQWTARQLYYACEEKRPRLYDQGLAGFVLGSTNSNEGYISIISLPPEADEPLTQTAHNTPLALRLLADTYSANAYAFSTQYQNCNQWVIEMLAIAWNKQPTPTAENTNIRQQAQQWLQDAHYTPNPVSIPNWMLWAAAFSPLVHTNDHPENDLRTHALTVSLPSSIEQLIRQTHPNSQRIEICHNGEYAIVHHGWEPLKNCATPNPTDIRIPLRPENNKH